MAGRVGAILVVLSVCVSRVAADDTLYRYEGNVVPYDKTAGWRIFDICENECAESIEDGHFVLRFAEGGDVANYDLSIAPSPPHPPPPPPTLWVEWRYKSNHALGSHFFSCDGRFTFRYREILDLVYMYGDAVISFSGSDAVLGLNLDEFHTFRFESTDGVNYTVAVDGQVFMDKIDITNSGGAYLQLGSNGGCGGVTDIVNAWDFVRYGTVANGEKIISADPPAGSLNLQEALELTKFRVTFDSANYVYIDDITVSVTGGTAPTVAATRRVDNTDPGNPDNIDPNIVEIVLDRLLPFGETTTFTFDTGDPTVTANCDPGAGEIVNCVQYTLPPPVCGDGVVNQPNEECDGSDDVACPGVCRVDCTCPACGDGIVDAGEECDDAGESAMCDDDCTSASCGDATVNVSAGETCDDGASNSDTLPDACRTDCVLPTCGDAVIDTGEVCDDGPGNSDTLPDTCRANCVLPSCGDSVADSGEECDESGITSTCDANCTLAECGDGTFNFFAGEQCDNGSSNSDTLPDACRTNCLRASCGDGVADTAEQCDGLDDTSCPDICRETCVCATCGDGILDADEQCDNGTSNSDSQPDACRTSCVLPTCGDDVTDSTESCDGSDDAACPGDCRGNCQCPFCGDGILDAGEQCDDGSTNSDTLANACRTTCTLPTCGDNVTDEGEECDGSSDEACPGDCLQNCTCEIPGIPTLSHWGLLALTVLLLAQSKRHFTRRLAG